MNIVGFDQNPRKKSNKKKMEVIEGEDSDGQPIDPHMQFEANLIDEQTALGAKKKKKKKKKKKLDEEMGDENDEMKEHLLQ